MAAGSGWVVPSREPGVYSCAPAACSGEFAVEAQRGVLVGGLRFRSGSERTKLDSLAVHGDSRSPFGAAERDSLDPGYAAACPMPPVFLRGTVSQVSDAIVRWLVVFVIYLSGRMLAVNIEPSKPVSIVRSAIDFNRAIPVFTAAPRLESCGGIPALDSPMEAAGSRTVMDQLSQPLRG